MPKIFYRLLVITSCIAASVYGFDESRKPLTLLSALPSSGFTAYVSWTNVFHDVAEVEAFEVSAESHTDYGTGSFTVDRDMFLEPEHYHLLGRVSVGLKFTI